MNITIFPARTPQHIADTKLLFRSYADWLENEHNISLEFQGIDQELAGLPGKYSNPFGELLLAYTDDENVVGCVAVRKFQVNICEIKRLYVLPIARGNALGNRLVREILKCAKDLGYNEAVLDTGEFMTPAQKLYEKFGFEDIPAYYHNPVQGVRYMGAKL
ncbi:MAG: GNAT family N-acetyltransferase [Rhodobacteraceae bacterium]|nr:GNAT family N-acetyltransferase [Paracoccaceae bacterium]